jgi:hypothetical protein
MSEQGDSAVSKSLRHKETNSEVELSLSGSMKVIVTGELCKDARPAQKAPTDNALFCTGASGVLGTAIFNAF